MTAVTFITDRYKMSSSYTVYEKENTYYVKLYNTKTDLMTILHSHMDITLRKSVLKTYTTLVSLAHNFSSCAYLC